MTVSLVHPDDEMPRTAFWEAFLVALRANPRFIDDPDRADLLFPAEDVALETNWPRYGLSEKVCVRGRFDLDRVGSYFARLFPRPGRCAWSTCILPTACRSGSKAIAA